MDLHRFTHSIVGIMLGYHRASDGTMIAKPRESSIWVSGNEDTLGAGDDNIGYSLGNYSSKYRGW